MVTHYKHDIDADSKREDRISQLPDDVILLIISRLRTTAAAVRTSVLSKRWKHVYTFLSEVRFYCSLMPFGSCHTLKGKKLVEFQRKFIQAVDTFFQHHSGSRITSFELRCCFPGIVKDSYTRWMNSVGRRMECLNLGFCSPKESTHPVFSSDFCSRFKYIYFGGSFQLSIHKTLKDLELFRVALSSEAIDCILLNCCSLESLKLIACWLSFKLHIHGPDLHLKNLTVVLCRPVEEIELSAINLTTFALSVSKMPILRFTSVPSLQNFFVSICDLYVFDQAAKDVPHLKCMYFEFDARLLQMFEIGRANKLSNLRELTLHLCGRSNLDLLALATFLNACPLLHKFHLSMRYPSSFKGESRQRVFRQHTQLKEVEFSGFSATQNEFDFVFYVLKNVVSLKRLSIFVGFKDFWVMNGGWGWSNLNRMGAEKKLKIIRERLQEGTVAKNVEIQSSLTSVKCQNLSNLMPSST